jgi:hypothetical protein
MDQRAVFLQVRIPDDTQGGVVEPQIDRLAEESLKTVGALEDSARSRDASLRQRGRIHGTLRGDAWRNSLPVRHRLGVYCRERDIVRRRGRDGVGGLLSGQVK